MFQILLFSAAYALAGTAIMFVFSLFIISIALKIAKKKHPSWLRIILAFLLAWLSTSFYLPFKTLAYYMENSTELYPVAIVFSVLFLVIVTFFDFKRIN
ncbi:hypothetical protein VYJ29_001066 [Yersinia enterocolitica]|nr:hypothetical protein [Yersinia enterocolitica]EKN5936161.1 hypothetical protein [Yersinia enterocolitica]EKN6368944.1 hypothetical protein [Yersinia enterocolitica]ELI7913470.1 hypothetical protein [Yersinia enterocolitica]ELI7916570.1 hypothetical protein [Yersinia enterocolitica]